MMPLLSRAAEHLYWLGRHLERLESTGRVIAEHTNLLVDLPVEVESDWSTLVAMVGGQQLFTERGLTPSEADVVGFLLGDATNPSSLAATVAATRENLRVTRNFTPGAAWEAVNQLHHDLQATGTSPTRSQALDRCDAVRTMSQQVAGMMSLLMDRGDGYALYEIGRYLERADMTTRILDSRVGSILSAAGGPARPADRSPFEDVRWLGMLRATDSLDLYHRCTTTPVGAAPVVQFLLGERRSPRSLAWCLQSVDQSLHVLPPRKLPALACANAARAVERGVPLPLSREGFHLHIDTLALALDAVHEAVNDAWFVDGQSVGETARRSAAAPELGVTSGLIRPVTPGSGAAARLAGRSAG